MVENIDNIILKDVTLFSVDCVQPEIALESLIFSSKHINFGETILFSNKEPFGIPQNIKFIQIPKINSLIEYSQFILTELNNFIKTDYCLSVHADGFIHNPFLWNNDFKKWDYRDLKVIYIYYLKKIQYSCRNVAEKFFSPIGLTLRHLNVEPPGPVCPFPLNE